MKATADDLRAAFESHRAELWDLCYRMTGSAADSDELLQEAFAKALAQPPDASVGPLKPWLVRVVVNLARDLLRQRKRRGYVGPWLPSPVELVPAPVAASPESRYGLAESASFAFLLALEVLTPLQRAVLVLRDVFDYTGPEVARALDITEANVRTTHHRARRAMAEYDQHPVRASDTLAKTGAALEALMIALQSGDVAAVERMLSADVQILSDGGGHHIAALKPVRGANRVARFLLGTQRGLREVRHFELWPYNGQSALFAQVVPAKQRLAPEFVLTGDVDEAGRFRRLYLVAAPKKLTAVRAHGGAAAGA